MKLPCSCFDENGSGAILTRFSSDIGEAGRFYSEILPDLLVNLVTAVMITGYFIQMDGRLIEDWNLQAARDCFSIVSQNVFLFPESIFWNVACGKEGASRQEVEEACRAAHFYGSGVFKERSHYFAG